jgi:hypothetical protein
MGIEDLIKTKISVKLDNVRADDWQKEMLEIWEELLSNKEGGKHDIQNKFDKYNITPLVDISPESKIKFTIVRNSDYVLTYFNKPIDEYVEKAE